MNPDRFNQVQRAILLCRWTLETSSSPLRKDSTFTFCPAAVTSAFFKGVSTQQPPQARAISSLPLKRSVARQSHRGDTTKLLVQVLRSQLLCWKIRGCTNALPVYRWEKFKLKKKKHTPLLLIELLFWSTKGIHVPLSAFATQLPHPLRLPLLRQAGN